MDFLDMMTISDISFVFWSLFIVPNRDDFHICSSLAYKQEKQNKNKASF